MAGAKGEMRRVERWAGICAGLFCALSVGACQRSVAASFVPSLQVQLRAHRSRQIRLLSTKETPWDASVIAWLRFRPTIAAAGIPVRAEFEADLSGIPCELDELTCLEEFVESERAIAPLLGQLE